ncbi:hypothetical protein [Cohnella thailandensis]|jgi:hypothetical protein|uniref:Uncharacterized protein n=1 Tax=Cohnella thailandensis TaxID=557557 RepID=A0A841SXW7_9BACL|nr:hypothetical protein [Cohnella thailandensis]MBB6635045.1 hypothetical protein [Cohnella thailandensis]MBP1975731.1 hypothetical protein [Cohnella thailandensis]
MKLELLSIGQSAAKVAAEGGQLIVDKLSIYGFFAFCLIFVACSLIAPALIYEKYFKAGDDPAGQDGPNFTA